MSSLPRLASNVHGSACAVRVARRWRGLRLARSKGGKCTMNPPNPITRKKLLQAGAAAGIAGVLPLPIQAASRTGSYRGKITVYGTAVPTPGHPGVLKLFQDFGKAHPGITIENHGFPSERFVALFTAAQASGEQVDMLLLNGQDLRRYAVAGDMVPLNGLPHLERFWPIGLKTYTINGKLWALPTGSI